MEFSVLNLLLVLLAGWLSGLLASRLGYPSILGELLAGVVLGPLLLGLLHGSEALRVLADLGVLLMMFYIGMEISPQELVKASWTGFLAAIGGFVFPAVFGYGIALGFGAPSMAALIIGLVTGVTALATKSRVLLDLNILDTRVAHVIMASALITDTLTLITFAGIMGIASVGGLDLAGLSLVLGKVILFFAASSLLGLKLFPRLWRWLTERGFATRTFSATLVLMIALMFAELAELAGLHGILGAFLAGLFLREAIAERKLSYELTGMVRDVSIGFLAPVFFVTAGFQVSLSVFQTDLGLLLVLILAAFFGKTAGTALLYLVSGRGWREGTVVGLGMNGQGAVGIILIGLALDAGLIPLNLFSVLMFMAITTTIADPLLLKWGVAWLARRDELVLTSPSRERVVLVGASPLACVLAQSLAEGQSVCLIDADPDHCRSAQAAGLHAVCGDILETSTLYAAGADAAKMLVAMTPNAEVNVLVAQLAREVFLVPKLYVVTTDNPKSGLHLLLQEPRVDTLPIRTQELYEWDRRLTHHQVEQVTHLIETDKALDKVQYEAPYTYQHLPLAVRRGPERLLFLGAAMLQPGDEVICLTFAG
jgi:Kef-type K+ transport system membrane component KefB